MTTVGTLTIEYRKPRELRESSHNARTHSDSQLAQIGKSIAEFGFTNPVLIDDYDEIIAGHGRCKSAIRLGMEEIPVIVLRGLSDARKRALALADNRIALNAGWNDELLKLEITELREMGEIDLEDLGFSDKELAKYLDELVPQSTDTQLSDAFGYKLVVDCRDETHQIALLERLEAEGLTCRPLVS